MQVAAREATRAWSVPAGAGAPSRGFDCAVARAVAVAPSAAVAAVVVAVAVEVLALLRVGAVVAAGALTGKVQVLAAGEPARCG